MKNLLLLSVLIIGLSSCFAKKRERHTIPTSVNKKATKPIVISTPSPLPTTIIRDEKQ